MMKLLILITFVVGLFWLSSCKKEKTTDKKDYQYITFVVNGVYKDMHFPLYAMGFHQTGDIGIDFQGPFPNGPFEGLAILFRGRVEPKTYTITSFRNSTIRMTYTDSDANEYYLERGICNLNKVDSLEFIYEGSFKGTFVREDDADSFVAKFGNFHF